MLLLADTISRLRVPWNKRPLIEADFHKLCRKHKVTVTEMPLRVSGFYYCVMSRHFIAINSRLSPQNKLFVMFHEFAHYRFINNKAASEWVGDILLAWPLGTTVDSYRKNHLAHHRYTNTEQDPDWVVKVGSQHFTFPQKWQYALANIVGYLVTINSIRDMRSILARLNKESDKVPRPYKLKRLAFYVAVLGVIGLTGSWLGLLMYWIVPYFTVFLLFLYLRSVAEHFGSMDYEHELGSSRTVYPHLWERAFFAPHNVNYHLDHHLYPSVPFYNLPQLHALLLANPQYRENAHITRGYSTGVVRECLDERQGVVAQPAE